VVWQTGWGEESGGSNPDKLHRLQDIYYKPLGAPLARIPKERKEHNGRVERSLRYNVVYSYHKAGMDGVPTSGVGRF